MTRRTNMTAAHTTENNHPRVPTHGPLNNRVDVRVWHLPVGDFRVTNREPENRHEVAATRCKVWGGTINLDVVANWLDFRTTPMTTERLTSRATALAETIYSLVSVGDCEDVLGLPRNADNPASVRGFVVGDVIQFGDGEDSLFLRVEDMGFSVL